MWQVTIHWNPGVNGSFGVLDGLTKGGTELRRCSGSVHRCDFHSRRPSAAKPASTSRPDTVHLM